MKKLLGIMLLAFCRIVQAGQQNITLESGDACKIEINRQDAEKSVTLRNLLEDIKDEETPIPLPTIQGGTLQAIVNCLQNPAAIEGIIAPLSGESLYAFNAAVKYLDIPEIHEKLPAIKWMKGLLKQVVIEGPVLQGHKNRIKSVAISSDGKFIVTGSEDKTARIWNIEGNQLFVLAGHKEAVTSVAISPDSKFIVTGSGDKTARIWNMEGNLLFVLEGHENGVQSVAISPDSKFIVTGSHDGTARVWNIEGNLLFVLEGHEYGVQAVAISGDGTFIITGSKNKTIHLWEKATGKQIAILQECENYINSLAISADNKFIVTGSIDKARILNIDGSQKNVLNDRAGGVTSVAISSDGSFIVTGSRDGTARIWNKEGTLLFVLEGHEEGDISVAISADSKYVVTGSWDKTARIWCIGDPGSVNDLYCNQLNLITKIYEEVRRGHKLDLVPRSTDKLAIRAQKKVDELLFRTLQQDMQVALHDVVILPSY
jgi:WD40 repeat protein